MAIDLQNWSPSQFWPFSVWATRPVIEILFALTEAGVAAIRLAQAIPGRWRPQPNAIALLGGVIGLMGAAAGLVFAVAVMM